MKIRVTEIAKDDPHYLWRNELIGSVGTLGSHVKAKGDWMSFEFVTDEVPVQTAYTQVGERYIFFHAKYEEVK